MNIHFLNLRTRKHEFCDLQNFLDLYPESHEAINIAICRMINVPIAFSTHGADGDGYIIADDEAFSDSFIMGHEEGHIALGHYLQDGIKTRNGIIDDVAVEMAADEYSVMKTRDIGGAIKVLQNLINRINPRFINKRDYESSIHDLLKRIKRLKKLKI